MEKEEIKDMLMHVVEIGDNGSEYMDEITNTVCQALEKQKEVINKILIDKAQDIFVEPGSIKEESLHAINLGEVLKDIDEV